MEKLTKAENRAYEAIMARPDKQIKMEDLINEVYPTYKPANPRQSVADAMRRLIAKAERAEVYIKRVSELGPGRMAVYQVVSKEDFLS